MSKLNPKPFTVPDCLKAKQQGRKLVVITTYDATSTKLIDTGAVDILLVGDSLGMVIQGHSTPLPVTLDEMIYHTKAVVRARTHALVVTDLPFMSYQISTSQALENAGRILKEAGAHAVKLEGGIRSAASIQAIVEAGIPVMGHVGMTPQSVQGYGGFKVQRNRETILEDARAVERAGAFAIVLECIPMDLAKEISETLRIPTIGIGAGPHCDGQVLVLHDLLGMYTDFRPKFVKTYADLGQVIPQAIHRYAHEVREGQFPDEEHSFK